MADHRLPLPDDFRCPISLEVMSDPVILSSGHTFDRSSIQRWLDSGHRTCPLTKLPLPDPLPLIPNHALRSLISSFSPPPTPSPPLSSPTYPSPSPSPSKLDSLSQLNRLAKRDPSSRRRLIESGAVSHTLALLDNPRESDASPVLVRKALTLILNLSLDDDNKVGLVAEGVIPRLSSVLAWDSGWVDCRFSDCRAIAATVITSLAVVEVNKAVIGEDESVIGSLVGLVREGCGRERKEGLTALCTLCSTYEGNRRRAVREGAVAAALTAVKEVPGLARGVELLGMLGKCREGRVEMVKVRGCVGMLVKVVVNRGFGRNSSGYAANRGKELEYGLMGLYWVCYESERVREEVRREGLEEECLRLVDEENANDKVSRNAKNLLKVLRGEFAKGGRI
ncbi:hypothetical protein MLD38_016790 [Melastoma candidum]|uniref:Uncharacterized protein n=1 Tax=Melastoma candidum TaxID=119954 RepID=A0ACB9QMW0_9MYRT|nr:hypothetical protein MLD38_016790 [Melastoma candidum]